MAGRFSPFVTDGWTRELLEWHLFPSAQSRIAAASKRYSTRLGLSATGSSLPLLLSVELYKSESS
jgi:hypothetical protein